MRKKLSFDEVKQTFTKNNCILLSKEYINAKTKLKYICKCGDISYITFDKFKQGRRCGCGRKGKNHWCYGKHRKTKTKKLISKRTKEGMTKKVRKRLSKILKGQHHSPKTEFKKGCISLNKGKKMPKHLKEKLRRIHLGKKLTQKHKINLRLSIHKHHIDLNHKNTNEWNFLFLTSSKHIKLHYQGYRYLVETGQVRKYIKWFDKKYGLK